jgi:hypothetical protein
MKIIWYLYTFCMAMLSISDLLDKTDAQLYALIGIAGLIYNGREK